MLLPMLGIILATAPGFQEIAFENELGPITRLADGRLFAATGQSRGTRERWRDTGTPQRIFGRYSSDHGLSWSTPQLLFEPQGPGTLNSVRPLGTRDGRIHIFFVQLLHLEQPYDWGKLSSTVWHTVSEDGGRSWREPAQIGLGRRWIPEIQSAIQLQSGRILVPFAYANADSPVGRYAAAAVYSDNGGENWRESKNEVYVASGGRVGESGAIEPVAVELADGRVWMVVRAQTGYLHESHSEDGGVTWGVARRTRFRSSNSPASVLRLENGPLLIAWNNEFGYNLFHGVSYSRQAVALALQENGEWKGYRQVNPPFGADDDARGTATYSFLADPGDGTVLLGYRERRRQGVRPGIRLFKIHPDWLRVTGASENFTEGLKNLYLAGTAGVALRKGPEEDPALLLSKTRKEEPCGFTWHFPLAAAGIVEMKLYLEPGFGGTHFSLSEYSLRPSDAEGGTFRWMIGADLKWRIQYADNGPYLEVPGPHPNLTFGEIRSAAEAGRVLEVSVEWDAGANTATLYQDGVFVAALVGMEEASGLAYLRIRSAADLDAKGIRVMELRSRPVEAELSGGFEGANPNRAGSILRQGPNRFLIRPFSEDPSNPDHKLNLLVAAGNPARRPLEVVVDVEWDEPKEDQPHWMLYRSVLMSGRGDEWKAHQATSIEGSRARFTLSLPPGNSYLGLSPKYTTSELREAIRHLPEGCAETITVGRSAGGRDIVGLRIARGDPQTRKAILLTSRMHPYETAGSFAAEGAIQWLCSPAGASLLDKYTFHVVPMANPDGVALGTSHLTAASGADLVRIGSDPSSVALKSLIDRIRPAGYLDYHQWMWRRDWIRTFMPEPETRARLFLNLEKTGFFDRGWQLTDASGGAGREADLRHYAMRRWGTRVAVPSFTWSGKNPAQMRKAGALVLRAFCELFVPPSTTALQP